MSGHTDSPSFLPRPGDLPRKELVALAERLIKQNGGIDKVQVFFKFTCMWCGTRCTFGKPNTLYNKGECGRCHKETEVHMGGLTVHFLVRK